MTRAKTAFLLLAAGPHSTFACKAPEKATAPNCDATMRQQVAFDIEYFEDKEDPDNKFDPEKVGAKPESLADATAMADAQLLNDNTLSESQLYYLRKVARQVSPGAVCSKIEDVKQKCGDQGGLYLLMDLDITLPKGFGKVIHRGKQTVLPARGSCYCECPGYGPSLRAVRSLTEHSWMLNQHGRVPTVGEAEPQGQGLTGVECERLMEGKCQRMNMGEGGGSPHSKRRILPNARYTTQYARLYVDVSGLEEGCGIHSCWWELMQSWMFWWSCSNCGGNMDNAQRYYDRSFHSGLFRSIVGTENDNSKFLQQVREGKMEISTDDHQVVKRFTRLGDPQDLSQTLTKEKEWEIRCGCSTSDNENRVQLAAKIRRPFPIELGGVSIGGATIATVLSLFQFAGNGIDTITKCQAFIKTNCDTDNPFCRIFFDIKPLTYMMGWFRGTAKFDWQGNRRSVKHPKAKIPCCDMCGEPVTPWFWCIEHTLHRLGLKFIEDNDITQNKAYEATFEVMQNTALVGLRERAEAAVEEWTRKQPTAPAYPNLFPPIADQVRVIQQAIGGGIGLSLDADRKLETMKVLRDGTDDFNGLTPKAAAKQLPPKGAAKKAILGSEKAKLEVGIAAAAASLGTDQANEVAILAAEAFDAEVNNLPEALDDNGYADMDQAKWALRKLIARATLAGRGAGIYYAKTREISGAKAEAIRSGREEAQKLGAKLDALATPSATEQEGKIKEALKEINPEEIQEDSGCRCCTNIFVCLFCGFFRSAGSYLCVNGCACPDGPCCKSDGKEKFRGALDSWVGKDKLGKLVMTHICREYTRKSGEYLNGPDGFRSWYGRSNEMLAASIIQGAGSEDFLEKDGKAAKISAEDSSCKGEVKDITPWGTWVFPLLFDRIYEVKCDCKGFPHTRNEGGLRAYGFRTEQWDTDAAPEGTQES